MAEHERRAQAPHPALETWAAYHAQAVSPEEAESLQDHLALCHACAALLLDLAAFPDIEPSSGEHPGPAEDMARAWSALQKRIAEDSVPAPSAVQPAPPSGRLRVPHALAASLLVATAALSFWVVHLRRTLRELSGPRVNVALHDLVPESGDRTRGEPVRLSLAEDRIVLILNLADPRSYPSYAVEVLDRTGRLRWSHDRLARRAEGNFTLELPGGFFPEGPYRIRVYGQEAAKRVPIAEYEIEFLAP